MMESGSVYRFSHSDVKMCESFQNRCGMVSRISYKCTNKSCKNKKLLSNPRSQKAKTLTSVSRCKSAGLGRRGHQMITASKDMYPHHI